jgi:nucleoside-diphosphate-sugar epimerase
MARILIAGCGYVGTALGERLVADSHQVWGLRRRATLMPPGVEPLVADLTSPQSLKQLPSALDFVFYMASPGGLDEPYYRSAFVDGLRGLLEALEEQRQRPRRLFFISSTAVYAQERGEWVDETSLTESRHFGGRRLLEAEELLLESPLPVTVVRFSGIYGPRRAGLIDRVRSGRAVYRPRPPQWTNRIHRDDCAGVLQHLMQLPKLEPLYLGVDCEPATERAVMEWLAGALGAPPPRAAGKEDAPARDARGNKRCRNELLLASGYGFRHPSFREGYRAILEELI